MNIKPKLLEIHLTVEKKLNNQKELELKLLSSHRVMATSFVCELC